MAIYAFTDVTFKLSSVAYSCSVSKASVDNEPRILDANTLCGPKSAVGRTKFSLSLEGFQDWFEAGSLAKYLFDHEGEQDDFEITWTSPDETDVVVASGTLTLVATGFGGTAEELATFSVNLPIDGKPSIVPTVGS